MSSAQNPSVTRAPHPNSAQSPVVATPALLDINEALRSTLRAWLVARDVALWAFCCGTDPAGDVLERIDLAQSQQSVDQMNNLREVAVQFASRLATRQTSAQEIINLTLQSLLETERPKFLLRVDGLPDSF